MMMEEQDYRSSSSNSNSVVVLDRISALPDCILGHILSFRPTRKAVATCLLSKRWKFSWVLLLTAGRQLNKFTLTWFSAIPSYLFCWINAAFSRNVHEITLLVGVNIGRDFQLPITSFNCASLRSLSLDLRVSTIVFDTTEVCLPRLETLKVKGSRSSFRSRDAFEKLIDGCPVLRYLKLRGIRSDYVAEEGFMYKLSSPSLTYLDMNFRDRCTLKLMAPSLEYLRLQGRMSEIFVEKSLTSLVTADLYSKVDSSCYLQDFVHKSEILQQVLISQADWRQLNWRSTSDVPRCLSKTLKKVKLFGYSGLEHELEAIRFVLEHGIALEVLQIGCKNEKVEEKVLKELCEFSRKYPACKVSIVFDSLKFPSAFFSNHCFGAWKRHKDCRFR